MALWAYVPDRVFVRLVPELPSSAVRLDTGKRVTDVLKWARACGYWDTEAPTVIADIQAAKDLAPPEVAALIAAFNATKDRAATRRGYVLGMYHDWQGAVGTFHDWLDQFPGYEIPNNGPMPTGPDTLATLKSQVLWMYGRLDPRVSYVYEHERRLTEVLIPLGNFMFTLAQALLDEIERSETFVPPIGYLVE